MALMRALSSVRLAHDRFATCGGVRHLDHRAFEVGGNLDASFYGVAGHDHADEAQIDLAVGEKVFAPGVEQHPVGRAGNLYALRDQAGQAERGRGFRVGVKVPAPRVRAHELFGHLPGHRPFHHEAPSVAVGVNVTHDVHNGWSGASAVITATSMSTYSRPRFSYFATTLPNVIRSAPA